MIEAAGKWMNARNLNPIPSSSCFNKAEAKFVKVPSWEKHRTSASLRRSNESSPKIKGKNRRGRRRLITISTSSDGKQWKDKWRCDYIFTLQELELQDLAEEIQGQTDTPVSITLSIQKHASFGLSVDGRIKTSFMRKCIICSSPYCSKLDTEFNVWVLPSRRQRRTPQMPEIGGDDPSVIYVKPGEEADLDSHIQDTIRLATSFQEACSESCDTFEPKIHYVGEQMAPSTELRWSKLLELKKTIN